MRIVRPTVLSLNRTAGGRWSADWRMVCSLVMCFSFCVGCASGDSVETEPETETETEPGTHTQPPPDVKDVAGGPGCQQAACFFTEQVWEPILEKRCLFCHYADGPAQASEYVLVKPAGPSDWQANFAATCAMARTQNDGVSQLLVKPTYQTDHGGGLRIAQNSEDYAVLEALVAQVEDLDGCSCEACGSM